jgi:hypothetical protein
VAQKCTRRAPDSSGNAPQIEHLGRPRDQQNSEPRWRTQALDWAERVTIRDRLVGYTIEAAEGWAAFDVLGELVGVFRHRAEGVTALNQKTGGGAR